MTAKLTLRPVGISRTAPAAGGHGPENVTTGAGNDIQQATNLAVTSVFLKP